MTAKEIKIKIAMDGHKKELIKKNQIYLKVKITPGSPKNNIEDIMTDQALKISIKAPAQKGKANMELMKFLSQEFETGKNGIKIIGGKAERTKLIKIIKDV